MSSSGTQAPNEDDLHHLRWHVARSSRYHMLRMGYFDFLHRCNNGFSILFGSATFVTLIAQLPQTIGLVSLFALTAINTADLVFGFSYKARLHNDLRKRFLEIEKDLETHGMTEELYRSVKRRVLDIEADEPNIMRALDTLCHNHLCHALDYKDNLYFIPWWVRATKHFINWDCTNLKLIKDIASSKKSWVRAR